jgi:hypothetical protein
MYQQGNFPLVQGQKDYVVYFSTDFPVAPPSLILVDVFNSAGEDPQEFLDGVVVNKTSSGFEFSLVTPPPSSNYVLAWLASDGLSGVSAAINGVPVSSFPLYNKPTIPDNTLFPVVIPNQGFDSANIKWGTIKRLVAAAHQHRTSDISDAGIVGISALKAQNKQAALSAIGAAAESHTHALTDLEEVGNTGIALLTSESAGDARAAINAAPSVHTHVINDLEDISELGSAILSSNLANILGTIGAAASEHTHSVDQVSSGLGAMNSFLRASTVGSARDALQLGNRIGWETTATFSNSRTLSTDDFGTKFIVSNNLVYTIPSGISTRGQIGIYVSPSFTLGLQLGSGVSLLDVLGNNIQSTFVNPLPPGFYVLECVNTNTFVLIGCTSNFQKEILSATSTSQFLTACGLNAENLPGVSTLGKDLLTVAVQKDLNTITQKKVLTPITSSTFSNFWSSSPAGLDFNVTSNITFLNILTLGDMQDGEVFTVRNGSSQSADIISLAGAITFNSLERGVRLKPLEIISFVKNGTDNLICNSSDISSAVVTNFGYVSVDGNDLTAVPGDINRPYSTISGLIDAFPNSVNYSKLSAIVLPGFYTQAAIGVSWNQIGRELNIEFTPGAVVSMTNGSSLFTLGAGNLNITGGDFVMQGVGAAFASLQKTNPGKFLAKVNSVRVESISPTLTPPPVIAAINSVTTSDLEDYFEADTVFCPQTTFANVSSSELVCKVRNLTTGDRAVLLQNAVLRMTVDSGIYTCANTIISANSSNYTFHLNLNNCTVTQGLSGYTTNTPLIRNSASDGNFKVSGNSANLIPSTSVGLVSAEEGNLLLSGVILQGPALVTDGRLILDNAKFTIADTEIDYCIDGVSENSGIVEVHGTSFANKEPNYTNLTFTGGNFISQPNLTIF